MLTTINAGFEMPGVAPRSYTLFVRFVAEVAHGAAGWAERRRQLRALAELDENLLRDVGLSREDVRRVCLQTFRMC